MIFRSYQAGDEKAIVDLWNQTLRKDPISAKRFRDLVLLDVNFDPEGMRLAFHAERLVGCVYAVRRQLPMSGIDLEEETGWIPFFFVHPDYQCQGIGTKLMEEALSFLKETGRKQVFFASYAPNYILPGMDEKTYPGGYEFLKKIGFEKLYSPVAMDKILIGYEYPEDIEALKKQRIKEGYSFTKGEDKYLYELIQFATNVFNPDWGRAIREAVLQGLPYERIFVATKGAEVIGFCLYGGYDGIPERFGPFGVDPKEQGKGLGKILLHEALKSMRSEGLHNAWFLWTGEKTAAGHLYKKAGFTITRTFHVMKKIMDEKG